MSEMACRAAKSWAVVRHPQTQAPLLPQLCLRGEASQLRASYVTIYLAPKRPESGTAPAIGAAMVAWELLPSYIRVSCAAHREMVRGLCLTNRFGLAALAGEGASSGFQAVLACRSAGRTQRARVKSATPKDLSRWHVSSLSNRAPEWGLGSRSPAPHGSIRVCLLPLAVDRCAGMLAPTPEGVASVRSCRRFRSVSWLA